MACEVRSSDWSPDVCSSEHLLLLIRRKVRGRFFQECDVFLLYGDLLAQPSKLGAFGGSQRLIARHCGSIDASSFVGDPASEQGFVDAQFTETSALVRPESITRWAA